MRIARSCFCACSTLALIAGGASAAHAQEEPAGSPASASAPTAEAGETTGPVIIVTAQKRVERLIDVPIAITALSNEALDDYKIEGGSELLRAVPNVNFSKSNFSMYNFSIRGIGTKAISASTDPAVAVSFNNTALIRNRLFESEFFDMERIEVLRGPQGTLYGRNATAGVVNMIPAVPEFSEFSGRIKGELGSYDTRRLSGHVNVPLGDSLAVRGAAMMTKRDGYDFNTFTGKRVNGRDLWSTRLSIGFEPSDNFRLNAIWQHFEEDDDRSRTGKQLCARDPGPAEIGGVATDSGMQGNVSRGRLSQGCLPVSLYDDRSYGAPNGNSFVFITVPQEVMAQGIDGRVFPLVQSVPFLLPGDPYAGITQSRDLREVSAAIDPIFRANNDIFQLNMELDLTEGLTFYSQTTYAEDSYYSSQDYSRYVSAPVFNDIGDNLTDIFGNPVPDGWDPYQDGQFCDPQLGCSDRILSRDLSHSENKQWSQEFRLQSDFSGTVNFSLGANYLNFESQDNYYVFNNLFTLIAQYHYNRGNGYTLDPCELGFEGYECVYIDPNPLESVNNQGHNYFLSQNGVEIESWAAFGELYWDINDRLKLTAGLRYTRDEKLSDQIPSQTLLGGGQESPYPGDSSGGRVNSGYPALPDIEQSWSEFTGRLALDWKPDLSFTDDTLVYALASRGYKGGGTNPPRVDFNPDVVQYQPLPQTFEPEYLNAFEVGMKNSFANGRFTLNAAAFYYDYTDYQVSQIVDRIAYNENFDASSMGLEFEAAWSPSRAFRLNATLGYLKTRIADGERSIDVTNRTQGNEDWVVLRPWLQVPSNCIAPREFVERIYQHPFHQFGFTPQALMVLCPGSNRVGSFNPDAPQGTLNYSAFYGFTYDPFAPYNPDTVGLNIADGGSGAPNGGRGFYADLSGNELPNAPNMTFNIGAQYTFFIEDGDWELTFRGDYYRQSESFARVYNTEYDRLKGWDNVNAAITLSRPDDHFTMQLYVKNLFDNAPITDFFTNSDDLGLTTNVFTLDPRIIGFSATVGF
ncbi:TonB-dependent receptor [Altererythrobacter marinus]|uniref:TonB-dependent receptor n=1 Tax=Pelagerythrobacter marinus TaxID=538382 RepID=A0ABW9V0I4_9SPHN|nr:TonB-dependent receptor [Pelagerythrobacter marinus]MXO69644.1 TonB-dependent receptor [Pelagerythrobacter marinus]